VQAILFAGTIAICATIGARPLSDGPETNIAVSMGREPVPRAFAQGVRAPEMRGYSILGVLDTLAKRRKVLVVVDQFGLELLGKKKIRDVKVELVEFPLPLAAALEYVAVQIKGKLDFSGQFGRIVPGRGDLLRFLSPPTLDLLQAIKEPLNLVEPVNNAPGSDIIQFFIEKLDIPIAPEPFDIPKRESFRQRNCRLSAGTKSLKDWLDEVANQMGGRILVRQEAIVIVPRNSNLP
jgi:hypothetical protein